MHTPSIDLGRACNWMFKSQNWMTNLMWVVICNLLGMVVIGHFVLVGYQLEIMQARMRGRVDALPDFDSGRFGEYLVKGLIPFAVYLVLGLAISLVMVVALVIWSLGFAAIIGEPRDLSFLVFMLPIFALGLLSILCAFCLLLPLTVRAGLTNNFAEGFRINWAISTAKVMWPTYLMAFLFVLIMAFLANIVGTLLCFIGVFVTAGWLQMAMADLGAQVYDIYEAKGGEPLGVVKADVL